MKIEDIRGLPEVIRALLTGDRATFHRATCPRAWHWEHGRGWVCNCGFTVGGTDR